MKKTIATLALALVALTGCSQPEISESEFVDGLAEEAETQGLTETQGNDFGQCVWNELNAESFTRSEITDVYTADTEDEMPRPELVNSIFFGCIEGALS